MFQILLVLVVLNGEPTTFAVSTESRAHCISLETSVQAWLPRLLGAKPEFFAAKCADLTPYVTAS